MTRPSGTFLSFLLLAAALTAAPLHALQVRFEQIHYVTSPGSPVELRVVIDHEGRAPESLFGYGIKVVPAVTSGLTVSAISVPAELDFQGFGAGAYLDTSPMVMGAKGNVGFTAENYSGSLIATYTLSYSQVGSYPLSLALFRTAGPTEEVFVDGNGSTLDGIISFGTTTITVLNAPVPTMTFQPSPSQTIDVAFPTSPGVTYTLQTSTTLATDAWEDLVTINGDGSAFLYNHPNAASAPTRFYRTSISFSSGLE